MILSSFRFAARSLRKHPGFALVAVGTLALGIGANTAIFSLVNTILLRPLPYPDADELVWINSAAPQRGVTDEPVSYPDFLDWQRLSTTFIAMGAYADRRFYLTEGEWPERVSGALISPEVLATLGVEPRHGRAFQPEEGRPGGARVALIGYALWQRRFGADPELIGRRLSINGERYVVIGIMPPRFHFPEYADLWLPLVRDASSPRDRGELSVVARLRPGSTLEHARTEMNEIARRLESEHPVTNAGKGVVLMPLRQYYVGDTGLAALVLLLATGLLLLIVCTNLSNLLLARAVSRQREIGLMLAIGASRGRVIQQLLAESTLLALLGAVPGVGLAVWGLKLLVRSIPVELPFWVDFGLDLRVLAFVLATAVATGVIFGLVPALQTSRPDLAYALKAGGAQSPGVRRRLTSALVVAEVGVALLILIVAGLMVRGFLALQQIDPGFRAQGVLTARISPLQSAVEGQYSLPHEQRLLQQRVVAAVAASAPGAQATTASRLPIYPGRLRRFSIEGQVFSDADDGPSALLNSIGSDYFEILGIPLRAGRFFDEHDDERAAPRAVVNETLARRYWPAGDAIGQRIKLGGWNEDLPLVEVVGVVGDVRQRGLDVGPLPEIYVPFAQRPGPVFTLFVRSSLPPEELSAAIRDAVRAVDPLLPVDAVKSLDAALRESLWQPSIYSWLLGIMAIIGLVLAASGVYGIVSYSVGQRNQEIGIRMALGASQRDVLRLVVGQAIVNVAIGVILGVAGAVALSGVFGSVLVGFAPFEPFLPSLLIAGFLLLAALAAFSPARRATSIEPVDTLRVE